MNNYQIDQIQIIKEKLPKELQIELVQAAVSMEVNTNQTVKVTNDTVKKTEKSQSELLIEMVSTYEVFHNELYEPFIKVPVNEHFEIWPISSSNFEKWIWKLFYDNFGKIPGSEIVKAVVTLMWAKARFDGKLCEFNNRVAEYDGFIWYDLTNEGWQAVAINKDGWKVVREPPVIFRRHKHQLSQTYPKKGGNVRLILRYINIKENDQLLFLVYLISCFMPSICHPILALHGEKGTAKTTTVKVLKKLIDPSAMETMPLGKDETQLVQRMAHHWFCSFDNITQISDNISDMLCKAVTGDGFSKRQLFTDDEDIVYSYKRCISLNGISNVATREDLLSRCIILGLERITPDKRKAESALWEELNSDMPYILGGIFDILSGAMAVYPEVKLAGMGRLADFEKWGYAIAETLGEGGDEFLKQYSYNKSLQNEHAIMENPLASAVLAFMKDKTLWEGYMKDLLRELERIAEKEKIDTRSGLFPKAANVLSKRLDQIKGNLEETGIVFGKNRISEGSHITIEKRP